MKEERNQYPGKGRLRLQQEPFLHTAGGWAERVGLNAGRWSVWWWIDERGLMASICLATKKNWGKGGSQEGHICHLTTCSKSRAYTKILSNLCWLTQKSSASRPAGRENTYFPFSFIPTSPLFSSSLAPAELCSCWQLSVQINKHLLGAPSVIYLC